MSLGVPTIRSLCHLPSERCWIRNIFILCIIIDNFSRSSSSIILLVNGIWIFKTLLHCSNCRSSWLDPVKNLFKRVYKDPNPIIIDSSEGAKIFMCIFPRRSAEPQTVFSNLPSSGDPALVTSLKKSHWSTTQRHIRLGLQTRYWLWFGGLQQHSKSNDATS